MSENQFRTVSRDSYPAEDEIRIALYGDVDLNLLDGSAIWLTSVVRTFCLSKQIRLSLLRKSPEKRTILTKPLCSLGNLEMLSSTDLGVTSVARLSPDQALDCLENLDRKSHQSAFVLRGFKLCHAATKRQTLRGRLWCYLTDIPQRADLLTSESLSAMQTIADASQYVLCQTEALRGFLERYVPECRKKALLLPPMIPETGFVPRRTSGSTKKIVYAGKFAPMWATIEMVEIFDRLRKLHGDVELHVFGDKIHNPPEQPDFKSRMESLLNDTEGVIWQGARSREQVQDALGSMDVAWSWRLPELDESLELSTKILEYGAAGLPVLLNRNDMHQELLGGSYPLFVNSAAEAQAALELLWDDPRALAKASARVQSASRVYTFPIVFEHHLRPLLSRASRSLSAKHRTVLIAGHDLRFVEGLREQLLRVGHTVLVDKWKGHAQHDESTSRELLRQADVVVSEWCLGNAVWYSRNINPGQRLVIRFHQQERKTPFPGQVNLKNVDKVIFVGPHIMSEARDNYGWEPTKLLTIPNYVDELQFARGKLEGSNFNLGVAGICPSLKRLDRALDILEKLRAEDERFTLFVKGKSPQEYVWLWQREEERDYYEQQYERIESSSLLRNSVIFDGYGDDIASWYRKIGFILSVSDHESFHLAVAEGGVSGAIPIVLNRDGAKDIFPRSWVYETLNEVATAILRINGDGMRDNLSNDCAAYAKKNFSLQTVFEKWRRAVFGDSL